MAKGKLTQIEKYTIQGMVAEGKSTEEIEKFLDRSGGKAVKNYINGELEDLLDTIVTARLQQDNPEEAWDDIDEYEDEEGSTEIEVEERSKTGNKVISSKDLIKQKIAGEGSLIKVDDQIAAETIKRLKSTGLNNREAKELFDRANRALARPPKNAGEMYDFCLRHINILNSMITETQNPRTDQPEVAIMTGPASAAADKSRPERVAPIKAKRGRGSKDIFRPKTGQYE